MFDRRHFLSGAGALLTASFVRRASAFSQKAGGPLILPSVRKPEETLYVYIQDYELDEKGRGRRIRREVARVARPGPAVCPAGPDLARASAVPWAFPRNGRRHRARLQSV